VVFLSSCLSVNGPTRSHEERYFNLTIPDEFEITKTTPVEDFEIYTISKAGKSYVGIYVGNQPKLPKEEDWSRNSVTILKSSDIEMFSVWKTNQLIHREVLFKLKSSKDWPTCVQAWTFDLPQSEIWDADRILSSIVAQGSGSTKDNDVK